MIKLCKIFIYNFSSVFIIIIGLGKKTIPKSWAKFGIENCPIILDIYDIKTIIPYIKNYMFGIFTVSKFSFLSFSVGST